MVSFLDANFRLDERVDTGFPFPLSVGGPGSASFYVSKLWGGV